MSFRGGSPEEILRGCRYWNPRLKTVAQAYNWCWTIVWWLLLTRQFTRAAHVLWSQMLFDSRPEVVRWIFETLENNDMVIVLGGASQGKSYCAQVMCLLWWLQDCEYSSIRIMGITGGSALATTFSNLQRFYSASRLPMPGIQREGYIGMSLTDLHASIKVLPTHEGQEKNLLQGWHPIRREVEHPIFGNTSRLVLFVDEGSKHPEGTYHGVDNVKSAVNDKGTVKIIWAANPENPMHSLGLLAAPEGGYESLDVDTDYCWWSKKDRYWVIRLDPARSENVLLGYDKFAGMLTVMAYRRYQEGGPESKSYWIFARGFFPPAQAFDALIPWSQISKLYGTYIFDPSTDVVCAGIDLAFSLKGGDRAIAAFGTFGKARGYTPEGGATIWFDRPVYCVQIDQFRSIEKHAEPEKMYQDIKKKARDFGVTDWSWVCIDNTGQGYGVAGTFTYHHEPIHTLWWGEKAPHVQVFESQTNYGDELFDGLPAFLYFTFLWLTCSNNGHGAVKISPYISDRPDIDKEFCNRQRKRSSRVGPTGIPLQKLEAKDEYKARMGNSPDLADAIVMCVWAAISKGPEKAQMVRARSPSLLRPEPYDYDSFNKQKFINWTEEDK